MKIDLGSVQNRHGMSGIFFILVSGNPGREWALIKGY